LAKSRHLSGGNGWFSGQGLMIMVIIADNGYIIMIDINDIDDDQ
jgi:hypothetical protein